ncbi:hypothetical protein BDQ12DRAFT_766764 [Crucibulum laeve]|uniref:Uncharacterized protein n=1 Tax=Crucibulum laeve TaxID=68775 RepID=A0A5C3LL90_9AGAR|nr:hypothetical protein BDQ12DRAFT_766764 [Crucibulum laeve]
MLFGLGVQCFKPVNFTFAGSTRVFADIIFGLEIISVDPLARTITIDWYPQPSAPCMPLPNMTADIYIDSLSLFDIHPLCHEFMMTFDSAFLDSSKYLALAVPTAHIPSSSSLQNYPFDVYFAPQYIRIIEHESGDFLTMNITRSLGIAVNFELILESSFYDSPLHHELYLSFKIERSRAIKIFVVIIAVANWLIATAFLTICAATLIYHSPTIYSEMFVVPVGAVLSLTSVRANLPGAPVGFGATIDLYSVLPVLVIMALCSFYLLFVILYRRLNLWERRGDLERAQVIFNEETCNTCASETNQNTLSGTSSSSATRTKEDALDLQLLEGSSVEVVKKSEWFPN